MKIAIYDPDPIVGGMMSWGRHMQHGLRMLGHECDIVTFTASGRPRKSWGNPRMGTSWYDREPDVTGRYAQCASVLKAYDRIVLTEPLQGLQDREAHRNNWSVPKYVRVLQLARVPFTTVLHSFSYDLDDAPFSGHVVTLPDFTGTGFAHADPARVLQGNYTLEQVKWVQAPHPYLPSRDVSAPLPGRDVAGVTGRFAHINGPHVPALMAARQLVPDGTTVQLRGASAVSNRPSFTLELYEIIRDRFGYEGQREGDDVFRHHNWVLWNGKNVIRYDGSYTDAVYACSSMTVHVSLMSEKNSTGVTNYAQLEAIDAGSLQVSTKCHWRPSFSGHVVDALSTMPSMSTIVKDPYVQDWLRKVASPAVTAALHASDEERTATARHNREVLREEHDPRIAAKLLTEVLG